jgi:hypothetical protein
MPVLSSRQQLMTASRVTMTWVLCALYIFTVSLLKTVMYPASDILLVLMSEFSLMPGVMWMSLAGDCTLYGSLAMSVAAWVEPSGSWNILSYFCPVGWKWSFVIPTFEDAPLLTIADGIVPFITPSFSFGSCEL